MSPYTAVSKLSRPAPGCAAAGARPGREPARINSRASKGTSDAASPRCPGDTRPAAGCEVGTGQLGEGDPGSSEMPSTLTPPTSVPPVQNQATTAGTGDTALRHVSGSTAPVLNVTLEEGPQSAPPAIPPLPSTAPQHHFGVTLQPWKSCWGAQTAVPLPPYPALGLGSLGAPEPFLHSVPQAPTTLSATLQGPHRHPQVPAASESQRCSQLHGHTHPTGSSSRYPQPHRHLLPHGHPRPHGHLQPYRDPTAL